MGWTYTHREKGVSHLDWFKRQFDSENEHAKWTVLDCATKGKVAYLAIECERHDDHNPGSYMHGTTRNTYATYVVGVICLIHWDHKASDRYNFGWKDIDESMGPYECECPKRILDLLSPIKSAHDIPPEQRHCALNAARWRHACQRNLRKVQTMPKEGETVTFAEPLTFGDGHRAATFTVEMWRGGSRRKRGMRVYRSTANGTLYRIPNAHRYAQA